MTYFFLVVIAREHSDRGNPTEKARNIYSVDLHPPGSLLRSARKDGDLLPPSGEAAATPPIGDKKISGGRQKCLPPHNFIFGEF